jgi:hypothetical protein
VATRRQFRDVASGMLGSFVGRNYAIDGYWGIGVLCRELTDGGQVELVLDLVEPQGDAIAIRWCEQLTAELKRRRMDSHWLAGASLRLSFEEQGWIDTTPRRRSWWRRKPKPERLPTYGFRAALTIEDDHGVRYEATRTGWCWPHAPLLEAHTWDGRRRRMVRHD